MKKEAGHKNKNQGQAKQSEKMNADNLKYEVGQEMGIKTKTKNKNK